MELKVEEIKSLAPVKFNYEDIKKWVTEKAAEYKSVVYTPETITLAKQDRATLNKVSDAINNEKKRIKNELLKPYVDFENKCKELMAIVDDASKTIDKQVKEFEEKEQNEKKEQIKAIFETYIGQLKDLIDFEFIFNPRWLNKTFTMKKIEEEINHLVVKTHDDLSVIDAQIKDENINKSVKSYYFSNINNASVLGDALQEGMRIEENNKKLEELKNKQNMTKSEEKITESSQNITNNEQNVTNHAGLRQIDFRVWVTNEQMMKLRDFLKSNNIEYGRVE